MQFIPVKTRELNPPQDNLYEVLNTSITNIQEKDILLITSKIVSIHQGRCIKRELYDKETLAIQEAQRYFPDDQKKGRIITIINHALALNAGIDPFHGYYIFLPENPNKIAQEIGAYLKKKFNIAELGIIITDSHSTPLRRGVMCYSVGYYGMSPLITWRDTKTYKGWSSNIVDAIAAMGGIYLGESAQKHHLTPIVIARDIEFVEFSEKSYDKEFFIEDKNDMYGALYKHFKKKKS